MNGMGLSAERTGRSVAGNTLAASGAAARAQCQKANRLGWIRVLVVRCSTLFGGAPTPADSAPREPGHTEIRFHTLKLGATLEGLV